MSVRNLTIITAVLLLLFALGCSGSNNPIMPEQSTDNPLRNTLGEFSGNLPDLDFREPDRGYIASFLLDGETGFGGIEVRVDGELAAVTDDAGNFELPPNIPEETTLEFAIDGETFQRASIGPDRTAQGPAGPAGEGTLYGYVHDEDGVVPGALVIVTDGTTYAFDFADSQGIYTVHGAPTGHVMVIAAAELHNTKLKVIDLLPNDPMQLDIFIKTAEGLGKLYGRAFIPGYALVSGVYVSFTLPGGLVWQDITNVYGMYELLNIPAGIGHLYAHLGGYHDFNMNKMVNPGFNAQDIPMIPINLGAVMGQVKTPDGKLVQGAVVRLTFKNLNGQWAWAFTYSGEQGQFGFGDIPPTEYVVQSFGPGWYPGMAAGTVHEGEIQNETLVMYPTEETGVLEGWAVDYDGNPVPYAWAYVYLIGFDKQLAGWTFADEFGHFNVAGLPYGAYAIRVETAQFLPEWTYLDILPNEKDTFLQILHQIHPDYAGALSGTIYGTDGEPEPHAYVGCYAAVNPDISFKIFSDENGDYLFPFLPATVMDVWAATTDGDYGTGFDEIVIGETAELDIFLE